MAIDYYDPLAIGKISENLGEMMQPKLNPNPSGWTDIYHGTPYKSAIDEFGFKPEEKTYWTTDPKVAGNYAKEGWKRGTPWGPQTGDVLKTKIPTSQAQNLVKRGFTLSPEIVLGGKESTAAYRRGFGNVKGSPSWLTRAARWIPKVARGIGTLSNVAAQAGALSDVFAGTSNVGNFVRDVNRLGGLTNNPNTGRLEPRSNFEARMGSGANRGFTETDYGKAYQRGGSVNPFEETARAGRDIGRGRDISGPRTRTPLRPRENEIFRDVEDKGIFSIPQGGRLGNIFAKGKSTYDWINENPYVPDINVGDKTIGYNLDKKFFGGDLDIGGEYDFDDDYYRLGFNFKIPLGGASHTTEEGIASLGPSPLNYDDFYMDKIIRDNPKSVMDYLAGQSPEAQEYFNQPVDKYKLDFGGPEIDQWIFENPGKTMRDLYDYLPKIRKTGPQPGDFWPGGATA
jgi:hypothetical protein